MLYECVKLADRMQVDYHPTPFQAWGSLHTELAMLGIHFSILF